MTEPTDPLLREAMRTMADALDRLSDARAEVERTPMPSFTEPRVADSSLMYFLASRPEASPELRAYAERVSLGECRWQDIDTACVPLPPEVLELKREPLLVWFPPSQEPPPDDEEPYTIPWQ
ncbi:MULTISPECIES: hypothetical protein [Nocardiaceae]|jgi:hypothetical protein|uniref:hypothetical protein n=1 Tax=Nocardiaceae TaxID=85025 RepID=UPI001E4C9D1E|nr:MULTISPECIES: hypothetical protein [Rhodococcus]MCC8928738.1 hypothetical protein [Rhodococcus sp. I2R]MCZ4277665.1 hypothetical protein [Rhodococcus yunnanensis]